MRVYRTGHEIADTVANVLEQGFSNRGFTGVAIGYGILRGMAENLRNHEHWFHLDRGFHNPGHYSGNYRISYKSTQARWHEGIPRKPWVGELDPRRKDDKSKPILVCPPTEPVRKFFGYTGLDFDRSGWQGNHYIRLKSDPSPLDLDGFRAVITFNSSVGWQALQRGIPVLSDVSRSLVGSFYGETNLESLLEKFHSGQDSRMELFEAMAAHDFTLDEIRRGDAWQLIQHYLTK